MRKEIKIVAIILIAIAVLFISKNIVMASTPTELIGELGDAGVYSTQETVDLGKKVVGIIQLVGTIVSVAVIMILGIKYMTGSIEEKVDVKKAMLPYLIGAILLFSASNLVGIIYNVITGEGSSAITPAQSQSGTNARKAQPGVTSTVTKNGK